MGVKKCSILLFNSVFSYVLLKTKSLDFLLKYAIYFSYRILVISILLLLLLLRWTTNTMTLFFYCVIARAPIFEKATGSGGSSRPAINTYATDPHNHRDNNVTVVVPPAQVQRVAYDYSSVHRKSIPKRVGAAVSSTA